LLPSRACIIIGLDICLYFLAYHQAQFFLFLLISPVFLLNPLVITHPLIAPTKPLPTEPPAPTKPKLTAEIEDQVIKDIVYAQ